MTVAAILRSKGDKVVTMRPDATVAMAVKRLRMENIGALVVSETGTDIAGVLSERDVVVSLASRGMDLLDRPIGEIMTRSVRTCSPGDKIGELMTTMTRYRIRHVPVLVDGKLSGIVSIGDVVKERLGEVELERNVMRDVSMAAH